ncbi:prepilin-type N-terminal cleavage/methylation domain-containing protein [Candidatus Saccharibacteria bacterium]|nr:prepilin-type N-terminal cleavage/methylation domain-containing protein [Candidatus Saccharibacteria bacterium]
MNLLKKEKGFTIIEVVLVLAIAGLIFLMVFIALPALQRNQRDTARKTEVSKILASITTYQSNNRGQSPSDDAATFGKYLDSTDVSSGGTITLESGTTVTRSTSALSGATPVTIGGVTQDNIVFVMGAKCATDNQVVVGSSRQASALIQLENGGGAVYCQTS